MDIRPGIFGALVQKKAAQAAKVVQQAMAGFQVLAEFLQFVDYEMQSLHPAREL